MVQKASSGGKFNDVGKSFTSRKNASTSTEGLGNGLSIKSKYYYRNLKYTWNV